MTINLPPCPRRRVLYIDDNADFALLLKRVLGYLGHTVATFDRPQAALKAIGAAPRRWDVVITDYNMPGMDGLGVARVIGERFPHLPCVVISGLVTRAMADKAAGSGFSTPLPKPASVREFDQLVRHASALACAAPVAA